VSGSPGGRESREDLQAEREFLLRSLDDLDDELVAGNIDPDNYRVLHDDYTARASAVIRSLADGKARRAPDAPRVPPAMRFLTIGGIVVFAVLAAILLAHTVGQRRAGQQITGDAQAGGSTTTVSAQGGLIAAKQAAAAQPKNYNARIRYARALFAAQVYPAAVQEYIVAAKLDPTQAEPAAYAGWLTGLFAQSEKTESTKKELFNAAESGLDRAIAIDPTYPDSYVLKGLLLTRLETKQCAGAAAFQQFLVTAANDNPMRQMALGALADAVKTGKCPSSPTTSTTKP